MSNALEYGLDIKVIPRGRRIYLTELNEKIGGQLLDPEDYSKEYEIAVVTGETEEKVAEMVVTVFDEDMIESVGEDIVDLADDMDEDTYVNIGLLTETDEYAFLDEDFILAGSWVGYIRRCYIYPEFRNNGVATYLLENLALILKKGDSINLRCASIYPRPQNIETGEYTDDPEMLKLMKYTFVKAGFRKILQCRTYVKAYSFPRIWR